MSRANVVVDTRRLRQLVDRAPEMADAALDAAAEAGVEIARAGFGASPPGRTYRRGRAIHTASQPGYPPNVDTGRLRRALTVERPGPLRRVISTGDVDYAAALEFGGRQMAARPFLRPMLTTLAELLPAFFSDVAEDGP